MSTNYSLLFYLKKPKNYVGGMKPIYMRITVAGDPKEVSTGRECDPVRWNAKANRAKGTKEDHPWPECLPRHAGAKGG